MIQWLKTVARDALPARFQTPIKYWYDQVRRHAEPEMALLPHLVPRGSHVADVGGNRGSYAYAFRKLGARVEIFEPNPICVDLLRHWSARLPEVKVHPVALSARSGEGLLHVPVDSGGIEHDASASIEATGGGTSRDVAVELRPLDSFGFDDLAFIKIDTEGHETSVISGATATISASRPAILVEVERRHHGGASISAVFDQIAALGYKGFFLRNGRLHSLDRFDPDRDQAIEALGAPGHRYINNFLFLSADRLDAGDYRALTDRWLAR